MHVFRSSMVGKSEALQLVFQTIQKVAPTDSTVLITGESGTGKELVARAIHDHSCRFTKPWVVVNCGAIPSELLEAELFGHVRGAFTGATQNRIGRFESAHTGTLFLDEIGDVPLSLQVKLLRVLQTRQFEVVGSSKTMDVDVRILAATNRDLEEMVRNKQFREDLYYRLNVIPISVTPLRERQGDVSILLHHFLHKFNQIFEHQVYFSEDPEDVVLCALEQYEWPGNVRELENLVERLVLLRGKGMIRIDDLPPPILSHYWNVTGSRASGAHSGASFPYMLLPDHGLQLKDVVQQFENHLIDQALNRTRGNKNRASDLLGLNRTTLVEKLRKRGMITTLTQKRAQAAFDRDDEGWSGQA